MSDATISDRKALIVGRKIKRMIDGLVALRDHQVPDGYLTIMRSIEYAGSDFSLDTINSTQEELDALHRVALCARVRRSLKLLENEYDYSVHRLLDSDLEKLDKSSSDFGVRREVLSHTKKEWGLKYARAYLHMMREGLGNHRPSIAMFLKIAESDLDVIGSSAEELQRLVEKNALGVCSTYRRDELWKTRWIAYHSRLYQVGSCDMGRSWNQRKESEICTCNGMRKEESRVRAAGVTTPVFLLTKILSFDNLFSLSKRRSFHHIGRHHGW